MRQPATTLFYWLNIRTWVSFIMLFAARIEVQGAEHIPKKGACILVSNHVNVADPPVLTYVFPRRVVWMAKRELFQAPFVGLLFRAFGLISVRRFEADLSALRRAHQALRRGQVLGMFPEGTRSGGRGLKEGEPGTAIIALRSAAPVLPVAIWGTENVKLPRDLRHRTKIWVRFGPPIAFPERKRVTKEDVAAATAEIMAHIAELLPAQYRGVYGTARPGRVASAPPGR
ncbi:MAG: 1-acyl-sn-glycerol-3-phosphate acyltransferase [Chloroflexi bacterium]|nr:MAG: 1-acyl-sn-glycerol-3-phosphate acyltransferase [Chloroflexota bacterium]